MTVMSDEELRQRKSAKTSNSSVKLEANSNSDNSIPSTSSLLVNLLQNKDNLLESSKVSGDSEPTTKNKSVLQNQVAKLPKVPGAIGSQTNSELESRSQNTHQQKSLMPPPSSPLTSGASGTIPTLTGDP